MRKLRCWALLIMFLNYFKVALRNLKKQKGTSVINITGLAVGIACCLLIFTFVLKELSYDRFHENSDRIYRIIQTFENESWEEETVVTPFKSGPTLVSEYPHLIEKAVRFYDFRVPNLALANKEQEKYFNEPNLFLVDSTVFDVFSIELIRGNPETALSNPETIVISEAMVEKYFGDEDPMGQTLFFEGRNDVTVTGIMKPLPDNSHIDIDFMISFNTLDRFYKSEYDGSWYWSPIYTYILLKEGVSADEVREQLPSFAEKYHIPDIPSGERLTLDLQALTDIHLYSNRDSEIKPNGNILYVYIFGVVALLILLIGCINFVNLATAKSAIRAKEIGVRKVLGADRKSIFGQFMMESFITSMLAILFALLFVQLMIPVFNNFLGTNIQFSLAGNGLIILGLFVIFIFVSLFAGLYPAVVLSGFEPVKIFRGRNINIGTKARLRKILVVTQFSFSVLIIIGTMLVNRQLNHLQNKDLGFDETQTLIIPTDLTRTIWFYEDFRQDLLRSSQVQHVTGMSSIIGTLKNVFMQHTPEGESEPQSITTNIVMYDFLETFDIPIIAGRSFSEEYGTDRTQAVIINKKLVEEMGWGTPEEALGKSFEDNYDNVKYVIGVTENFNHSSLRKEIESLILEMPDDEMQLVTNIEYVVVKINGQNIPDALSYIEETWKKYDQTHPIEYSFHEEEINEVYSGEQKLSKVSASFSVLGIIVACFGLFGLASFMAERRTKEIGIRKVLGAGTRQVVVLLSRDFLILVFIANIIAWPFAYLLGRLWLQDFPYRIELGWNLFQTSVIAIAITVIISLVTVGYRSIKAASINPVDSISRE